MAVALLGCIPGISTWAINEGARRFSEYQWERMIARYNEDMHKLRNEWYAHNGKAEISEVCPYHLQVRSNPAYELQCSHEFNKYEDGFAECPLRKQAISNRYTAFLDEQNSRRTSYGRRPFYLSMFAASALALSILFMPAAVKATAPLGVIYVTFGLISTAVGVFEPFFSRIRD